MAKIAATGTIFKILSTSTATGYVDVAFVRNISGPTLNSEFIDVTTHDSTSGNYREIVPTFISGGEVSLELLLDTAQATHSSTSDTGFMHVWETKQRRTFRITFPTTANNSWTFGGYVTGFEIGAPVDEALTANATVTIDGGFTWST